MSKICFEYLLNVQLMFQDHVKLMFRVPATYYQFTKPVSYVSRSCNMMVQFNLATFRSLRKYRLSYETYVSDMFAFCMSRADGLWTVQTLLSVLWHLALISSTKKPHLWASFWEVCLFLRRHCQNALPPAQKGNEEGYGPCRHVQITFECHWCMETNLRPTWPLSMELGLFLSSAPYVFAIYGQTHLLPYLYHFFGPSGLFSGTNKGILTWLGNIS